MDGLDALYDRARHELGSRKGWKLQEKRFDVRFRAYAGLNARIWDRQTHYEVRLSELLREAPRHVQESLARILIGKIDRRLATTRSDAIAYRSWARTPEMEALHHELRRRRGRKTFDPPQGRTHDLGRIFHALNAEYFQGRIPMPRLGWSRAASRRLYGHHDVAHDAIVINRVLDHPRVPEFVVASILHHEMLHVKHGVRYGAGGRRILHPWAFRRDEGSYRHHDAAAQFLKDLAGGRIRLRSPASWS